MRIFNIFKKKKGSSINTTENGATGPTFLENHVENIINPENLYEHEWRRKLKSTSGGKTFRIKYYGERHYKYKNLIVQTEFAPSKIIAVDVLNEEEIVLFDGCFHGYDAMFCYKYSEEQINNRKTDKVYTSENGNEKFEIIISTFNGIDYEDEFREDVDSNGKIELINGKKIDFEEVKRNGFDTLQIWGIDERGVKIEIVSEELA